MRTIVTLACTALAAGTLGACAMPDNQRTTIGSGRLGDGSAEVTLPAVSGGPTPVALTDAGAPLTGLDRSSWASTTLLIPNDHTEHHPHVVSIDSWTGVDYSGAAYPTLDTALGVESDSGDLLAEWLFWPVKLVRDDLGGVRQLGDMDRGVIRSPFYDSYQRTPGDAGE